MFFISTALFPGRQIQLQSFYVHRIDMHRRAKKIGKSRSKPEFCNPNDRLNSRLVIVRVRVPKKSESLARDLNSLSSETWNESSSTLLLNLVDKVSITRARRIGSARETKIPTAVAPAIDRQNDSADPVPGTEPRAVPECVLFVS